KRPQSLSIALDKPHINFLSKVCNHVGRVVLDSPKPHGPHQVQEYEALEALLEFVPEHTIRELLATLPNQISGWLIACFLPAKPADVVLHISDSILAAWYLLPCPTPNSDPTANNVSTRATLVRASLSAHREE